MVLEKEIWLVTIQDYGQQGNYVHECDNLGFILTLDMMKLMLERTKKIKLENIYWENEG